MTSQVNDLMRCAHCEAQMTGRKRRFCNQECRYAAQKRKRLALPKFCEHCGVGVFALARFCKAPECRAVGKREERKRAAERAGKDYLSIDQLKERAKRNAPKKAARDTEREARKAWKLWMREKAPGGWVARYWKAAGMPWKNNRLDGAIQYRIRYKLDAVFRGYERARSSGHRKRDAVLRDGSITMQAIRQRFDNDLECLYCGCDIADDPRYDHMQTRSLGGSHSVFNLAPACKQCNNSKGAKPWAVWLASLSVERRTTALRYYHESRRQRDGQMRLVA